MIPLLVWLATVDRIESAAPGAPEQAVLELGEHGHAVVPRAVLPRAADEGCHLGLRIASPLPFPTWHVVCPARVVRPPEPSLHTLHL